MKQRSNRKKGERETTLGAPDRTQLHEQSNAGIEDATHHSIRFLLRSLLFLPAYNIEIQWYHFTINPIASSAVWLNKDQAIPSLPSWRLTTTATSYQYPGGGGSITWIEPRMAMVLTMMYSSSESRRRGSRRNRGTLFWQPVTMKIMKKKEKPKAWAGEICSGLTVIHLFPN